MMPKDDRKQNDGKLTVEEIRGNNRQFYDLIDAYPFDLWNWNKRCEYVKFDKMCKDRGDFTWILLRRGKKTEGEIFDKIS
jgi:hypothetical protein